MRVQSEITTGDPLLDKRGVLTQRGYATKPLLEYRRKDFTPVYDRYTENKLLFVDTNCHHEINGLFTAGRAELKLDPAALCFTHTMHETKN